MTVARILLLLSALASVGHGGQTFRTSDPLKAFVHGDYPWGDDYFIHGNEDTVLLRCVLVTMRDGFDGVALSEVSIWGNHGGPWEKFKRVGKMFEYVGSGEVRDTSCLESCRSKDYLASGRCQWQRGWPKTPAATPTGRSTPLSIDMLGEAELSFAPFECDCEFYRGDVTGHAVVFATRAHRMRGMVKIDGTTRQMRLVRTAGDAQCRKGRPHGELWTDGAVTINLETAVTTSGDEACWYQGRMTVTQGERRARIAVTGSCGC